ncbi:protein kinase domain-containing protein [Streptomyces gardneri]|uniref:protein kinase domain-containing protein n=1 Tax=Streptomyces gardneri TaxID=66892 RepID=UPI0033D1FF97
MLGHYQVAELLGAGGMGEVYLAHSPSGRAVAVKVIREDLAAKPGFRERFAREVQAARQVSGAFTAPVLDADTTGPTPWMATQYVEGPTLADIVNDRGTLPADEVWRLASGLCEALRDIHRAGLVHRDLKPGNILLAEDGPRVIDFGISRVVDATALTQSGQILGTPLFMAPEQFRTPRDAGPAADVFALGSVLVHAATGHGPFDADSPYAIAWNAVHEEPNLTGLPESLRPVVEPCLRKDPAQRPAPETLLALLSSRRERRTHRTSAREAELARVRRDRLRHGALALSALSCAALIAGVWTWWSGPDNTGTPREPLARASTARPTPTPVRLPGWKPWTTQLAWKDRRPGAMPSCHYEFPSLWCTGSGLLVARLDTRTGKPLWQRIERSQQSSSDISVTSLGVFVGSETGDPIENPSYTVRRFDTETGSPSGEQSVTGVSSCRLDDTTLLCLREGKITAWDPMDMTPMWSSATSWDKVVPSTDLASESGRIFVARNRSNVAGMEKEVGEVSQGDGVLFWSRALPQDTDVVGMSADYIYAESPARGQPTEVLRIDRRTGATKSVKLGGSEWLLGLAGGVFYTQREGGVVSAYDISAQKLLWSATTLQRDLSPPTIDGDRVHFTALDGTVIGLDRKTGVVLWQQRSPTVKNAPPTEGAFPTDGPRFASRPVVLGDIVLSPAPFLQVHSFLTPQTATAPPATATSASAR